MPRELCVGNGNLLISFDGDMNMRDIFYPFVGMENHVSGHFCRIGAWVDGKFSWIDKTWEKKLGYKEDSLVTEVTLKKLDLQLELKVEDGVPYLHNIFVRRVTVKNLADRQREVRLFFSHDLHLAETDNGITAYYNPKIDAVVHFKKDRYFLISGSSGGEGLYQFAVGATESGGLTGTWKDAEDGELSNNPVAHGSVDSAISLRARPPGGEERVIYYWIAAGKDLEEVIKLGEIVAAEKPETLIRGTEEYHRVWANKSRINFDDLPPKIVKMFKRSLLVLRTQIDNRGAIIASSDSDILRFNKDTYSYMWPRDGAFVAMGLDAAGYHHATQRFYRFCKRVLSKEGFLYQKYHPDGSWGSTWHAWMNSNREFQLPIQEDETALVLFSLWNHYDQARDIEFIVTLYKPLICRAADFLVQYRDSDSGMILPSYDLWEENYGISTFTASAVFGGLKAASRFAKIFGDAERSEKYDSVATEIQKDILKYLYDEKKGRFLKIIKPDGKGGFSKDDTIDSSIYGIFGFGVLPANDVRVAQTMKAVESSLWVKTDVGGVARYQNDSYQRIEEDFSKVPGNPWPICTLWLAEWYIAQQDLKKGRQLLEWVVDHASQSGILPEQIHPYNNEPLSVSPLTWSHSTFVLTVIEYLNKCSKI